MATEIEATYRVVTPMFCGGADPERHAELRLESFKGVLRFWWRALAWSRYAGDLRCIRKQEDKLFGSAGAGQSWVSMRLSPDSVPPGVIKKGKVLAASRTDTRPGPVVDEGARYLGYGVMKGTRAGELTRACLRAPFEFTVRMRLRENERDGDEPRRSLIDALICLGTHGGMGARSRKGYGSLVIRSLRVDGDQRWNPQQTPSELADSLAGLRRNHSAAGLPEYTALSGQARHLLVPSGNNEARPMELLDLVGRELMRYRSWGHRGRVLGSDSEKNFKPDHDLMKIRGHERDRHPERIAFGLPHNYGQGPDAQVGPQDPKLDRRASPLFIHIHECGGTPVAVLSFLPARFLPKGRSDISVGRDSVRQVSENGLYQPIHRFLDRLLTPPPNPRARKEPFGNVVEVK